MISYLVLTPPGGARDDRPARLIADKGRWLAFFFPAFWLLFHRAWLAGIAVLLLQTVPAVLLADVAESWQATLAGMVLNIALGLLVSLEGPLFVAGRLVAGGWTLADIVPAPEVGLAEAAFAERQAASRAATAPALPGGAAAGNATYDLFGPQGVR
ncbi:DUF2628 domain-containing protein [Ensifer soli]|uniref:DUF2628 domain-containing protein n=1 Tax=Ciceribacter sp. sgz301302 TaxID=3342379 RepID=UPI0035B84674